ncbi:Protein of unknown function [Gryllus bimaculatus]|nr:Protein of unknown function [Gryllus bimaculatus]
MKPEDDNISKLFENGVDDIASVHFARLQDASSVEGSPTVALPVYITPSTFPGKEGELLLIPARRMSNYNEETQGANEKKMERSNVVEDPEDNGCISAVEIANQILSPNCVTSSELKASDIDKLDENVVQNILNDSFTGLAESDSDGELKNVNPKEELEKSSARAVLNSTFTESDLLKATEESPLYTRSIHCSDSSSMLTSVSGVSASVKESCAKGSVQEITVKAHLDCTESEYCAAGSIAKMQEILSDTSLQESNNLKDMKT